MRSFIRSISGQLLSLLLCVALIALTSCVPPEPLTPVAGVPELQRDSVISLGHARVNTAGGNLIFELRPMVVDTPLGPQSFGAVYNSADGTWTWSYYGLEYDGEQFVDPTGHHNSLNYLDAIGRLIPYNRYWMPLSAVRMKTAGGLVHEFDAATHRLKAIYRSSADFPRIQVLPNQIQQCMDAITCDTLFEVDRDAEGRIISVRDRPGAEQRSAHFVYDIFGRLTVARSAGDGEAGRPGFRFQYSLLTPDLLAKSTSPEREAVSYAYDSSRRAIGVTLVGGGDPTTQLVYGAADGFAFTRMIDPLGHERVYRHDELRQLREVTDGEGWTTSYEWEGLRKSRETTPAGVVTQWIHDGETTQAIRPSGHVVTRTTSATAVNLEDPWQPAVLEIRDLDENGAPRVLLQNSYDATGLLFARMDGNGDTLGFDYDQGMLSNVYVPYPHGGSTYNFVRAVHGPHGHPTEIGYLYFSLPFTEPQSYTSAGDPTSGTDMEHAEAEGRPNIRLLHYDHDRNLSAIDYGLCVPDPQNTLECSTTETNPDEGTTTLTRRSDGRPLLISRPLGNGSEFLYDVHGRLVERRDRVDGVWQSTTFGHDAAGRLTSIVAPNQMAVAYEYDANGQQTKATWTKPGTTTIVRDTVYTLGRVTLVYDSVRGGAEVYEYDAAGRVSAVDYPLGERMELAYDGRDLVTQRRLIFPDATESLLETVYDGTGTWRTRKLDGMVVAEQDRMAGILRSFAFGQGSERVEREWRYSDQEGGRLVQTLTHDAVGSIIEITDLLTDGGYAYTQLEVASDIELASGPVFLSEKFWETDEQVAQVGPKVYGEGEWEQVPGVFQPTQYFFYDPLGNRIDPAIAYNSDHTRLLSAFGQTYTSDASGYVDRIDDVGTGTSTVIVRNAQGRAVEVQGSGASPVAIDRDTWGRPSPDLFGGLVEVGAGGARRLDQGDLRLSLDPGGCHLGRYFDFRGNVRFTVDLCSGLPQKALEYGAYGVSAVFGNDDDERSFALGREVAPDLLLLGARLYQPSLGRFLSPDPILQHGDQFAYAEGNPVRLSDPSGETIVLLIRIILRFVVIAAAAFAAGYGAEKGRQAAGGEGPSSDGPEPGAPGGSEGPSDVGGPGGSDGPGGSEGPGGGGGGYDGRAMPIAI